MKDFVFEMDKMGKAVYLWAVNKGFWKGQQNEGEKIALMHSELSEGLEWLRKEVPMRSDHIPDFLGIEEELADCVIRIMDFAEAKSLRLGEAIVAKMKYNMGRPHMHGKKF